MIEAPPGPHSHDLPRPVLLRSTNTSPFGRKVRIALDLMGIAGQIPLVPASPVDPADPLRLANPLGKMPALILADDSSLFDSPVILDYLDLLGANLFPAEPGGRLRASREQALADGMTDAAVLMGSERLFHTPEQVSDRWLAHQRGKVERALAAFAAAPPTLDRVGAGAISLACGLGYLDWRQPVEWREPFPALVEWLDAFRAHVPAFDGTAA